MEFAFLLHRLQSSPFASDKLMGESSFFCFLLFCEVISSEVW